MITKHLISGYAPVKISRFNGHQIVNVQNFNTNGLNQAIYCSFDGTTTGVTTLTGLNPGIRIPTGESYQLIRPYYGASIQGYPVWCAVDGTGINTVVIQEN